MGLLKYALSALVACAFAEELFESMKAEDKAAEAAAADDGRPAEWDEEEDGVWEAAPPKPWEPVWWTRADEQGVKFIENYDETEPEMVYRDNGFRYKILKNGTTGQQAYGPLTNCKILGEGWTSREYPKGRPILWEKNKKKPLKVRANNVMPCWEEAMNYMEIGSTWEFVCTPELGYKEKEQPGVPPHSVLIFRLTLVKCDATRDVPVYRDL